MPVRQGFIERNVQREVVPRLAVAFHLSPATVHTHGAE